MHDAGIGKRIEYALGLEENTVQRIIVSEEDLNKMLHKLESVPFSKDDRFIVNLTCGTKIMSIGVYEYFSRFDSSFYYIPIGKNKIEDVRTSEDIPLNYRVNLKEYLTLYGLTFEKEGELLHTEEETKDLFNRFKRANFNRYRVPEILNAQTLPKEIDRRYYSGVWFEEYTYLRIKEEKGLAADYIWRGVKLFRPDSGLINDNEIDVMYVIDNKLYVGECKMSLSGTPMLKDTALLEQYMYKLAAISKDFGLAVNPYIFTLHRFYRFSENSLKAIEKRKDILGIKGILSGEDFKQQKLNI
ncbi:hypothetical protein AGMMS49574_05420 [Bacteroidia bacterium]|nr:hypothetical protein AGMMS49574_05420 [Bacteroidia bacterium]